MNRKLLKNKIKGIALLTATSILITSMSLPLHAGELGAIMEPRIEEINTENRMDIDSSEPVILKARLIYAQNDDYKYKYYEGSTVATITKYIGGPVDGLTIPDSIAGLTITEIGEQAFKNQTSLTGSLVIGDTVTDIDYEAFDGCSGFTSLSLGNNITTIGMDAFCGCKGFKGDLIIPDSVTTIGNDSFKSCSGFDGNLIIGKNVTTIGPYAFYQCTGFNGDLIIGDKVTTINQSAFSGCSGFKGTLTIGNQVTKIDDYAFQNCYGFPGSLVLPKTLTTLGSHAFKNCAGFTGDLVIPEGVTNINNYTFYDCSGFDGQLTLPENLASIDSHAFQGCSGLSGDLIIPDKTNKIGYQSFTGCTGFNGKLILGEKVSEIGDSAFKNCGNFTGNITIPEKVTKISMQAFYGCGKFSDTITIPSSVTSIGTEAFARCAGIKKIVNNSSIALKSLSNISSKKWKNEAGDIITEIAEGTAFREDYGTEEGGEGGNGEGGNGEGGNGEGGNGEEDAPDKKVIVRNEDIEDDKAYNYEYPYDEQAFFSTDPTGFNLDMVRWGLGLAMVGFESYRDENGAFRKESGNYDKGYKNAKLYYEKIGYENVDANDYFNKKPGEPDIDTIGVVAGSKKITIGDKDYTVILASVRGAGYEQEWGGNFNVYGEDPKEYANKNGSDPKYHEGFKLASDQVISFIKNYINQKGITGECKLVMAGYSRAAATTNLTIARIDDGELGDVLKKENVYGFCFETPAGTTSGTYSDKKYDNIINVINPEDPVPLAAPVAWGFHRFGREYYTPSLFYNCDFLGKYYKDFSVSFNEILKNCANENKIEGTLNTIKKCAAPQQLVISPKIDKLANALPKASYYDLVQKWAIDTARTKLGGVEKPSTASILGIPFFDKDNKIVEEVKKTLDELMDNKLVMVYHYPSVCLSWLATVKKVDYLQEKLFNRYALINCPVDVKVFSSDGNLVAYIKDEVPQQVENGIVSYVDDNGQKTVVIPGDDEYTSEITAREDGIMDCVIIDYSVKDGIQKETTFKDIKIKKGDVYNGTFNNSQIDEDGKYTLAIGGVELSSEISDTIKTYIINTKSEGNGTAKVNESVVLMNEFVQVEATPNSGAEFFGWFIDGEKVSSELTYRFRVEKDTELVAKFTGAFKDDEIVNDLLTDKVSSKSFTAGSDTYTVSWNSFIRFDGRKHNGVGTDISGNPVASKESGTKVSDLKLTITKNGELVDPTKYTVKTKNNKNATVSIDGITAIGSNRPVFTIKFKGDKEATKAAKAETFEFGIIPAELKQDLVTFDKVKNGKDGSLQIKKMTFKPETPAGGTTPKPVKLKFKKQENKTDYVTEVMADGSVKVAGKNNFYGSVVYKK